MVDFSRRREPSINNRAGRPVLYIVRPGISVGTAQMTKGVTKSPFLHNIIAHYYALHYYGWRGGLRNKSIDDGMS